MEEMIGKTLERDVIKSSSSPWESPVVLVAKRDGSNIGFVLNTIS